MENDTIYIEDLKHDNDRCIYCGECFLFEGDTPPPECTGECGESPEDEYDDEPKPLRFK